MRLVQFLTGDRQRRVGIPTADGLELQILRNVTHVYHLAQEAHRQHTPLAALAAAQGFEELEDYEAVIASGRILAPLDHPADPARFYVSGTGLDHKGSALARNAM